MILWFSGISGAGKTTIANAIKSKFKKNLIHIDGDKFRSLFGNDLKYSLKDRNKNAERLISFIQFLADQKLNLIISANLTSNKYRKWCQKNFKDYLHIFIEANMDSLKKRDYKNLYKKSPNNKLKNIVRVDIKFIKPKYIDLTLSNNKSKKDFLKNIKKVQNLIKSKKIKIY